MGIIIFGPLLLIVFIRILFLISASFSFIRRLKASADDSQIRTLAPSLNAASHYTRRSSLSFAYVLQLSVCLFLTFYNYFYFFMHLINTYNTNKFVLWKENVKKLVRDEETG